jgi:hypothetical protein
MCVFLIATRIIRNLRSLKLGSRGYAVDHEESMMLGVVMHSVFCCSNVLIEGGNGLRLWLGGRLVPVALA